MPQLDKESSKESLLEKTGENGTADEDPEKMEEDSVHLSDEETDGDLDASQTDSFSEKVRAIGMGATQEQRFSSRLASKNPDDVSILEKAKNYKAKTTDKDEGTCSDLPTVLNTDNASMLEIASLIGVDLGTSLEMVEHNLDLIRLQEQARDAMYRERVKSKDKIEEPVSTNLLPSDVDKILKDLLMINQDDMDKELGNINLLNFCATGLDGTLASKHSNEVYSVKSPVRTVLRRGRKKKGKC